MTDKIEIQKSSGNFPLYHRYPGQYSEQGAYIEIDFQDRVMLASWNAEIGNGIPFSVYHGLCHRFSVSSRLFSEAINELLFDLEELANEALAGFRTRWDGSNWVGEFTGEAQEALEMIENIARECIVDNVIVVDCWGDWFQEYADLQYAFAYTETAEEFEKSVCAEVEENGHILAASEDLVVYTVESVVNHIEGVNELSELNDLSQDYPGWLLDQEEVKDSLDEKKEELTV